MSDDWTNAKPLTAATLRSRRSAASTHHAALQSFATGVMTAATTALQVFNTAPVKVSRAGEASPSLKPTDLPTQRAVIVVNGKKLAIWIDCDRNFEIMLADFCLGGAGIAPDDDEMSRPQTKFEQRLRDHVLKRMLAQLPPSLADALLLDCVSIEEEMDVAEQRANAPADYIRLNFLVNVFSVAAEFGILAKQDELNAVLGVTPTLQDSTSRTAYEALLQCVMTLEVCLPPALAPAEALLRLQEGSVLPLNLPAKSPVHLRLGDCEVASGRLRTGATRMEIVVAPQDPERRPETVE